jgi:hypothetical protein
MTFTVKYNRTSVHIDGIPEQVDGSEFNYAKSACPALSRSGYKMAVSKSYGDVADALEGARGVAVSVGNRMCAVCERKAQALADAAGSAFFEQDGVMDARIVRTDASKVERLEARVAELERAYKSVRDGLSEADQIILELRRQLIGGSA